MSRVPYSLHSRMESVTNWVIISPVQNRSIVYHLMQLCTIFRRLLPFIFQLCSQTSSKHAQATTCSHWPPTGLNNMLSLCILHRWTWQGDIRFYCSDNTFISPSHAARESDLGVAGWHVWQHGPSNPVTCRGQALLSGVCLICLS